MVDEHVGVLAFAETGLPEDVFEHEGGLGSGFRMLKHNRVSEDQRGDTGFEWQPDGEVPRLNDEDRPERLVNDLSGVAGLEVERLWLKEVGRIFDIVV